MAKIPVQIVTNPVWLRLFNLGWEEPGWGKATIDQHAIAMALHALSQLVTDSGTKAEVQRSAAKMLVATSERMIKEAENELR